MDADPSWSFAVFIIGQSLFFLGGVLQVYEACTADQFADRAVVQFTLGSVGRVGISQGHQNNWENTFMGFLKLILKEDKRKDVDTK